MLEEQTALTQCLSMVVHPPKTPAISILNPEYAITVHYLFMGSVKTDDDNYRSFNPWQVLSDRLRSYPTIPTFHVIRVDMMDRSVYRLVFDQSMVMKLGGYGFFVNTIINDIQTLMSGRWIQGDCVDIIFPGLGTHESRIQLS